MSLGPDEFFWMGIDVRQGWAYKGRQGVGGPGAEPPERRRSFQKFSLKFRKNYNFQAKFFENF